jgi:hypothetical protein
MDGSITAKKRFPAIPYMVLSKKEVKEILVAFKLFRHGQARPRLFGKADRQA